MAWVCFGEGAWLGVLRPEIPAFAGMTSQEDGGEGVGMVLAKAARELPPQQPPCLTSYLRQHGDVGRRSRLGAVDEGAELGDSGLLLGEPCVDMGEDVLAVGFAALFQEVETDLLHVAGDAGNEQSFPWVAGGHAGGG